MDKTTPPGGRNSSWVPSQQEEWTVEGTWGSNEARFAAAFCKEDLATSEGWLRLQTAIRQNCVRIRRMLLPKAASTGHGVILESPHHSFPFCILTPSAIILFVQSEVVTVNGKDSPQAMRRILQENPDGRVMLLARRYHEHANVQEAVQTEETSNHWAVVIA